MPELPEVTTITNQLNKEIIGKIITTVESINGYRTRPDFTEFRTKIEGGRVSQVKRIAKTINIGLDSGNFIVIHLAMTGRLLLRSAGIPSDPWLRLIFHLDDGRQLRFTDPRLFGYISLMNAEEIKGHRGKYGPDPLDLNLTSREFLERLRLKRTGIKRALLEQDLIAGVGNIYANDGLWEAKIHPETPTENIDPSSAQGLLESLRSLLAESISHRGSTLDDKMYIDLYGREGEQQKYFRVFGKAGQPCPRCQRPIEFKEVGDRQTYFCPNCQVKSERKFNLGKQDKNQLNLL